MDEKSTEKSAFLVESEYFVTAAEAAEILGRDVSTLAHWRRQGKGPTHYRKLGRVVYRIEDLRAALAVREGTA